MSTMIERRAKVLVVDDHALVRYGLVELLSNEKDMEICGTAASAEEALQKIGESKPDMVVIDIKLQGTNGLDLIKRIRTRHADMKMIVSSMYDESLYAPRALQAGAMGYVNKQEATETLVEAIRQVLRGQVFLSAVMARQLFQNAGPAGSRELSPIHRLSNRELEVFEKIGQGMSTRSIANQLHLSVKTIETHRENIKGKLGLKNAAELHRHAVQWVLESG